MEPSELIDNEVMRWKMTSLSLEEAAIKYGDKNARYGVLDRQGNRIVEVYVPLRL